MGTFLSRPLKNTCYKVVSRVMILSTLGGMETDVIMVRFEG